MRRLLPAIAALCLLGVPASASADCPNADLRPSGDNLDDIADATLCLHNEERATVGLPALERNEQLSEAAREHAVDMVSNQFFEHENLEHLFPADRIAATGYSAVWSSENIFYGYGDDFTPRTPSTSG